MNRSIRLPRRSLWIAGSLALAAAVVGSTHGENERPALLQFQALFANDPFRHSLSLATGLYGTGVQGHQLVNLSSELDYGVYLDGGFTAGIQGGEIGSMVDLGTTQELANRYGYQETVGGGQGFTSIHIDAGRVRIVANYQAQTFQPLVEGNALLAAPLPQSSIGSPAALDHIYLVRIVDASSGAVVRFAKMMVTSITPGDRVDIVFQELTPNAY